MILSKAMKIRHIFYLLLAILLLHGCGQVIQSPTSSVSDTIPTPSAYPVFVEDGVTGGTYSSSDGNLSVNIPSGSIYEGLSANPTVTKVSIDSSNILAEGESLVSNAYELNLQSIGGFVTTNTVEVTMAFDSSTIPAANLTSQYVLVKVYDAETGAALPISGSISGSNITAKLKGLPKNAVFSVVYNPNLRSVISSASSGSSIDIAATQNAPWRTNRWLAVYSTVEATLRSVIAGILGTAEASLTSAQMDAVIKQRIADNAAASGAIYQTAGFRQPNLEPIVNAARTGTTEPAFIIHVSNARSSSAPQGSTSEAIPLLGLGYGSIYIESNDVNDTPDLPLGSILDAIAHEMFHAIQFGYDVGYHDTSKGYAESTAATYGSTIDRPTTGKPQVRLAESAHKLSSFLGNEEKAYENQDFFAYVGRAYNSNSLSYLADMYEQIRKDIDVLVAAGSKEARVAPPRNTIRQAINTAFTAKFSQGLPAVYLDFLRQRAMDHSNNSQLRIGEITTAKTLFADLFAPDAIKRKTVDPQDILVNPVEETFINVAPFSSRVIVITPGKAVENITAGLTITSTTAALGSTLRTVLYRKDQAGEELTGVKNLTDYAKTTTDILTILVANTGYTDNIAIKYKIGPPAVNTLEASVSINSTNYTFSPKLIVSGYGTFSGTVTRSSLPTWLATESRDSSGFVSNDTVSLLSDPNDISSSEGVYSLNEADKVFENNLGAASITYHTPSITDADDGSVVVFESKSGSITFQSYGSNIGDYISGTFEAQVQGSRETSSDPDPSKSNIVTLTGTISGRFGITLGSSAEVQ